MHTRKITYFDIIVYLIIGSISVMTLYPFINVFSTSISGQAAYISNPMMIFPKDLTIQAYIQVLKEPLILSSYRNTIITTVFGTALSMVLTILTAFPLSRRHFKSKPFFIYIIIITMLFNGGLIPNFYLVRSLGMYDTLWALIIPGCLSTYNLILMISFLRSIPDSLEESARIDGANDMNILIKIMIPLSLPIIATLAIFYAVGRWNAFFNAIIYIRDRSKWTIQLLLREIVITANAVIAENADPTGVTRVPTKNIKYATIIIAVLPIITVYPFMQKYFIKGVMVGSIKG